jgi:hypothetical protein
MDCVTDECTPSVTAAALRDAGVANQSTTNQPPQNHRSWHMRGHRSGIGDPGGRTSAPQTTSQKGRRRHHTAATDADNAPRQLTKLLQTPPRRRLPRAKGRAENRRTADTRGATEEHRRQDTSSPAGAQEEQPHSAHGASKEPASTKRRQAAHRPGKTLRAQKGPRNRRKQMVVNGKRLSAWKLPGELAAISSAEQRCVVPDSAEAR